MFSGFRGNVSHVTMKLFDTEKFLSCASHFLPLVVVIHSVKSILWFDFANNILPSIEDLKIDPWNMTGYPTAVIFEIATRVRPGR